MAGAVLLSELHADVFEVHVSKDLQFFYAGQFEGTILEISEAGILKQMDVVDRNLKQKEDINSDSF